MRSGAVAGNFYNWVDGIATSSGLSQLVAGDGERKIYDTSERLSALGHYVQKFDGHSRLTGQLAWRVFQKT